MTPHRFPNHHTLLSPLLSLIGGVHAFCFVDKLPYQQAERGRAQMALTTYYCPRYAICLSSNTGSYYTFVAGKRCASKSR